MCSQGALAQKDHPNMHMIWFESMKKDHRAELENLCMFLGKSFTSEQLTQLQVMNDLFSNAKSQIYVSFWLQELLTLSNMRERAKNQEKNEERK